MTFNLLTAVKYFTWCHKLRNFITNMAGTINCRIGVCLLNSERTRVHWARELVTEQPGPNSSRLFDLGSTAATLIYRQKIHDLDHLKEVLTSCWEQVRQDLIDKVIDQWLIRISLVMQAKGWHIEHRLDWETFQTVSLYDALYTNAIATCLFAFVSLRIWELWMSSLFSNSQVNLLN